MEKLNELLTKLENNKFHPVKTITTNHGLNQLIVVDEVLIPLTADNKVYRILKGGYELTYYYKINERKVDELMNILKNNNVVFDVRVLDDLADENYLKTQLKIRI